MMALNKMLNKKLYKQAYEISRKIFILNQLIIVVTTGLLFTLIIE